jgi:REP element-mobilizing transposase RayT
MPRVARSAAPGSLQHLISRFCHREFRLDTAGRRECLRRYEHACGRVSWRLLGFALMSSHLHHVALAGLEPPSRLMAPFNSGLAMWLNRQDGRLGPAFAARFTNVTVAPEQAARLLAYVHNNPVRAGLVSDPADSTWTSHRAYLGEETAPPWLDVERGLALAGFDSSPAGRAAFHDYVRAQAGCERDTALSGSTTRGMLAAARRREGGPVEPCSVRVVETGEAELPTWRRREISLVPPWPGPLAGIIACAGEICSVDPTRMISRDRRRTVVRARRVSIVAATRLMGRPLTEIAAALGISVSAASQLAATADTATLEQAAEVARALGSLCRLEGVPAADPPPQQLENLRPSPTPRGGSRRTSGR